MKSKGHLMTVLLILFSINIQAQISEEIKSYVDSTETLVNSGRKMLVQSIASGDLDKTKDIYHYLSDKTYGNYYSAFYFTEDLYINILVGDWHGVERQMQNYSENVKKFSYPNTYSIYPVLYSKVTQANDSLLMASQKSDINDESKKTLRLLFYALKAKTIDDGYNSLLSDYKKNYKKTGKETDFVDGFLPAANIKMSLAWSIGSGMVLPTSSLADNFKPNASINVSMDVNVNKVYTSLHVLASGLKLKEPFTGSTRYENMQFQKNELFEYFDAGLKGGYFLIRNNRFHVAPYLSISGSYLKSDRYDSDDDKYEYEIYDSFTYGGGLHTEVKIANLAAKNGYAYDDTYISVKLDAGCDMVTSFKNRHFQGDISYFSLAFVWGVGNF